MYYHLNMTSCMTSYETLFYLHRQKRISRFCQNRIQILGRPGFHPNPKDPIRIPALQAAAGGRFLPSRIYFVFTAADGLVSFRNEGPLEGLKTRNHRGRRHENEFQNAGKLVGGRIMPTALSKRPFWLSAQILFLSSNLSCL